MDKCEKQADSKFDCCVICGKPTEYRRDITIEKCEFYVDGVGQLCRKWCFEIYIKSGNEGTS